MSNLKSIPQGDDQTNGRAHAPTNGQAEANGQPKLDGAPSNPFMPGQDPRSLLSKIASYWWVELVVGVLWVVIAVVVLKFNHASVTTVGILTGLVFLLFAAEQFVIAAVAPKARWVYGLFGVLMTAAGIVALIHPTQTFAGLADILGAVFLLIAVAWMVQAFSEQAFNQMWWTRLIAGILMTGVAFWVSGQYYMTRAATLLVFVGVWAAMKGILSIIRAFEIRNLKDFELPKPPQPGSFELPHVESGSHHTRTASGS